MRLSILIATTALSVYAQTLSVGVVGGGSPTDSFSSQIYQGQHAFALSKDFVVGGMVELSLGHDWSVEADGLFRELHLRYRDGRSPVVTWEFPVLAKYRLPGSRFQPFVEAGPSLRTAGNLNRTSPSHFGVTGGIGVDLHWRGWKISPVARYTYWAPDDPGFLPSAQNQVELLAGFSRETESKWRPFGSRVSVGVLLGTSLTGDFSRSTETLLGPLDFTVTTSSGPRRFIGGPELNLRLVGGLSVELDGLNHPVSRASEQAFRGGAANTTADFPTWEFPVLAKYAFRVHRVEPVLAVGPSFRLSQDRTGASPFGAAAGAGVQFRIGHLVIAPGIRVTHWAESDAGARQNQSQLLVGFSF